MRYSKQIQATQNTEIKNYTDTIQCTSLHCNLRKNACTATNQYQVQRLFLYNRSLFNSDLLNVR